jgi:hypothetical protein
MAVACAATVDAARKLLMKEVRAEGEEMRVISLALKDVQERMPEIFSRPNAEFVLLSNGQLQVQDLYLEMLRKKIAELEKNNTFFGSVQ